MRHGQRVSFRALLHTPSLATARDREDLQLTTMYIQRLMFGISALLHMASEFECTRDLASHEMTVLLNTFLSSLSA